jgi:ARG and Rhodanese-Phosphatase-superfamily-associated Protein domain
MRVFLVFTVVALVAAFLSFMSALAHAAPLPALGAGNQLLQPLQYKQLVVIPVVRKSAAPSAQYLTLSEGVKRKLVTVSEQGQGGTVNRVQVQNRSDKPLLLLGGEVILGGQQDRILGKDTVIPAHEKMVVEVFCVEHGRWNGHREFTAADGFADGKMRVRAKFRSSQQAVWDEVAKKNAALKADPSTGTYRNLAVGAEGEKAKKPYRDFFSAELKKQKDLVGLVSAINGRVTSVDIFDSPSLFAAYQDKLLDSIVMSAVDVPAAPKAKPPSAAEVEIFVQKAEAAAPQEILKTKAARTVTKSGKGVLNSTVESDDKKPIYKSYQLDE